jgi:hypothetical protein
MVRPAARPIRLPADATGGLAPMAVADRLSAAAAILAKHLKIHASRPAGLCRR